MPMGAVGGLDDISTIGTSEEGDAIAFAFD